MFSGKSPKDGFSLSDFVVIYFYGSKEKFYTPQLQ